MSHADKLPTLLIVEDSPEDLELIRRGLKKAEFKADIRHCIDGDDALDFLDRNKPYENVPTPSLILLDLNLPGTDGRDVLRILQQNRRLAAIPVVVFSNSSNSHDVDSCYALGANSFIEKPLGPQAFTAVMEQLHSYWWSLVRLPAIDPPKEA